MSFQERVRQVLMENASNAPGMYFGGLSEWQKCVKKYKGVKNASLYYDKENKKCRSTTKEERAMPAEGVSWKDLVKRYGVMEAKRIKDAISSRPSITITEEEPEEEEPEADAPSVQDVVPDIIARMTPFNETPEMDEIDFEGLRIILEKLKELTQQEDLKVDIDNVLTKMRGGRLDSKLVKKLLKRKGFKKQYKALLKRKSFQKQYMALIKKMEMAKKKSAVKGMKPKKGGCAMCGC
jgi:hypothetical protein